MKPGVSCGIHGTSPKPLTVYLPRGFVRFAPIEITSCGHQTNRRGLALGSRLSHSVMALTKTSSKPAQTTAGPPRQQRERPHRRLEELRRRPPVSDSAPWPGKPHPGSTQETNPP